MRKHFRMTEAVRIRFERMNRIQFALANEDFATAKEEIDRLLEAEPLDPQLRYYVSMALGLMGDTEGALREALLSTVLEPVEEFAGLRYRRVAHLLARQGKTQEAQQILKIGWEKAKTFYPRKLRDKEKEKYFAIE